MKIDEIAINGKVVSVLEGGYKFEVLLTQIKLLKNQPVRLYHPMGWCTHDLSEGEKTLIRKAKKRWNMVYK